jgi:rubredoxin
MKKIISFIGHCPNCNRDKVKFDETDIPEIVECPYCHFRVGKKSVIKVMQI